VKRNQVRIVGGAWRSRWVRFTPRAGLRPTPDRVRETLFNWLGQDLTGKDCLDLFAGSGALGFEAASRGAARVVMVEHDRAAFQALGKTLEVLKARQVELVCDDAFAYLRRAGERFDVVFLDPPFGQNVLPAVLRQLKPRRGMRVYVESGEPVAAAAPWRELKRQRAGKVSTQLFEWRGDDQGGLPGNV
jgi:16S rRNA (guanine966-N2)-methyltransferase